MDGSIGLGDVSSVIVGRVQGSGMSERGGDRWVVADAYEAYMGRWSRLAAREFLAWLDVDPGAHWLEVGCGTGALTAGVRTLCAPASVVACDPSAAFVEHLNSTSVDAQVSYAVATADTLPSRPGGFDAVVSGLVLNFIPQPGPALQAMHERCRIDGVVAAYFWDYAGGVDLLHHFWQAVVACEPQAADLDEARRFGSWDLPYARSLFEAAGFAAIDTKVLTVSTTFATFDDYWTPFLGGTGPAPAYVASLTVSQRELLAERLSARLPRAADHSIPLQARALAVRGVRR